jgi:hypothetical protein
MYLVLLPKAKVVANSRRHILESLPRVSGVDLLGTLGIGKVGSYLSHNLVENIRI